MPDIDSIARDVYDRIARVGKYRNAQVVGSAEEYILAALRRVEADTREECAKRCDQFHDTGVQHWHREKNRDRRMIVHAQALAGKCLANELRGAGAAIRKGDS